ncbi:MAG: hypothetical protein IID41_02635 [Planctomycetes bacterium]|nr:hypothetical protein [Planctomycetota bacterium]
MNGVAIASVYVWTNGMVMAFGPDGLQIGEYQGLIEDKRDSILAHVQPGTEYFAGAWRDGIHSRVQPCENLEDAEQKARGIAKPGEWTSASNSQEEAGETRPAKDETATPDLR